jgi:FlaA1/EpsC-like NDP-sugar epimerase
MTRYFMTIPEAVQLIIRAGSLGPHLDPRWEGIRSQPTAEVLVLDMGEPVRIVELARAMIELSGLDPERDIDVEIVGRRPGEKLHEELFNDYERRCATTAEKILLAERAPLGVKTVEAMFEEINLLVLEGDAAGLAAKVAELSSVREAPSTVCDAQSTLREAQSSVRDAPPSAREAPPEGVPPSTGDSAPVPLIHSQSS